MIEILREYDSGSRFTRIRGEYGAVRHSRTFEVVNLDMPREYMSLDTEVAREAINKDKAREIPGLRIFETEALRVRGMGLHWSWRARVLNVV
jgi:hypothetical protein